MAENETRCARACSECGQNADCPYKATACTEPLHPCDKCNDCVYGGRPWRPGWRCATVTTLDGQVLKGRIAAPPEDDRANPEGTCGHIARISFERLLQKNPAPAGTAPQAWILTVLRATCSTLVPGGGRDQAFEDQVMKRLFRHYGAAWGMQLLLAWARGEKSAPAA